MTTPLIIAAGVYLAVGLAAAAVAAYAHALSCRLSGLPPNWGGAGPIIGSYVVAWPFITRYLERRQARDPKRRREEFAPE